MRAKNSDQAGYARPKETGRPSLAEIASYYDGGANHYDAFHGQPKKQARFRRIEAPMLEACRSAHTVLELGSGTGRLLAQAKAPVRIGVDVSREMLRQSPTGLHRLVADAQTLPIADDSVDVVLAGKGVFRYLDYERAFGECKRVLRPGGKLFVHQYAARTWSIHRHRPSRFDALHVNDLDELIEPAAIHGLKLGHAYLFRSVRIWPYALPIPGWLPGRFWAHCTLEFEACR